MAGGGGLAMASIASLWLYRRAAHQSWSARAEEHTSRVYFIISQKGVDLGGRGGMGLVEIKLRTDMAPKTCRNFISLCLGSPGYGYTGTSFHRIVPGVLVQGGDTDNMMGQVSKSSFKGGHYFKDENFELKHDRPGLLSMANKGPNTNGSQFFITLQAAPWLDGQHVVFGEVTRGLEVLRRVEQGRGQQRLRNLPVIVDCGLVPEAGGAATA